MYADRGESAPGIRAESWRSSRWFCCGDPIRRIIPSVLKNQDDCVPEILKALFLGAAAAIGAGHLRTRTDKPVAIALNDYGELRFHTHLRFELRTSFFLQPKL
jgi:hypothetical protein